MKYILPAAVAMTALMAAPTAVAQSSYFEGGYKAQAFSADDLNFDFDLGAIYGRYGYDFTENFAVEGELGYGIISEDLGGGVDLKGLTTGGFYGKAGLPLGERVNIFARAGLGFQELELSGAGADTFGSENGFAFGGGLSVDLNDTTYIRADYTRLTLDGVDLDEIGIAVGFRF